MENTFGFSFDDEYVSKFCYHIDGKKIEFSFEGYYDINLKIRFKKSCVLTIENWVDAKSKVVDDSKIYPLEKHLSIVSMILSLEINVNDLKMIVNTMDGKYLELSFHQPEIHFTK